MIHNQAKAALIALTGVLFLAAPAFAGPRIDIAGRVATVCRVSVVNTAQPQFTDISAEGESRSLGRMTELCNNVEGYRLVLVHPAGLENAYVVLDGERIALASNSTRTVIVDSNRPAYRERDMALVLAKGAEPVSVSIEAQAKGMVF